MHPPRLPPVKCHKSTRLLAIYSLVLLSLAIALGGCKKGTPLPTASPSLPTSTPSGLPQPLPPALVESEPLQGEQLALKSPITFYFNQPMQRASVEDAISGEPALSGSFTWRDDSTLVFTPDAALSPDTSQTIQISTVAQSAKGIALQQPISLSYTTSAYLSLVQNLPADGEKEVAPTSAVVAAFNQPVVALGADPGSLPAGFTISPSTNGKGEWINTSTYIFYPDPALAGGTSYQVQLNPDLLSTGGSPLKSSTGWSFDTTLPRLVSTSPADGNNQVRLDTNVQLNFSYSMDAASVEDNFSLQTGDGALVGGISTWNDDFTTFTYTPTQLLDRATTYQVLLGEGVAALGGTLLDRYGPITWTTYPELSIVSTEPSEGGILQTYEGLKFILSSPIDYYQMDHFITITPGNPVFDGRSLEDQTVSLYYMWNPETDYTLTVSPDLTDLWGSRLGKPYTLHFKTAPLHAGVEYPYDPDYIFLTTQDEGIMAQVTNLSEITITVGTMTVSDLIRMLDPKNGSSFRYGFVPRDAESWIFYPQVPRNQSTTVSLPISSNGKPRPPGLYFMQAESASVLVISHYHMTLKISPTEALVWAVDLDTNTPAAGKPITIYDGTGGVLASGSTDASGVFRSTIPEYPKPDYSYPYNSAFAILGKPGEDSFGFTFLNWNEIVGYWNFEISADYSPRKNYAYLYTDRPIYRPGDKVYFRLVARQAFNGRYSLPDTSTYSITVEDPDGEPLASFELPLTDFGTASGEYAIPADAQTGTYVLADSNRNHITFEVTEYRKPEINLQVAFKSAEVISGTALQADIEARYFFDAPAGNLPFQWVLYQQYALFHLADYQVGPVDTGWLQAFRYPSRYENPYGGFGYFVARGESRLDSDGLASLNIPIKAGSGRQVYTLEVTLTDESGLPVSARSAIFVNPAPYYIGVHPDAWSYVAGSDAGFSFLVVDLAGNPAGVQTLSAKFQRVEWVRTDPSPARLGLWHPTFEAIYTPLASTNFSTDADGVAHLAFTPPEPGTYQLDVSGGGTLTQVIVWVGGAGRGVYPDIPNQRVRLVPDQDGYKPGDIAQIFIPNPFGENTIALLTVERGKVMRYQIVNLGPGGNFIPLALTADDAPNVYISVTLLGRDDQGHPDYRQGYTNLSIDPSFESLKVSLTSQPERAGPRDPVTFGLHIADANGNPVQGEFSLSVVDSAVLSLADPNSQDIFSAFYGQQQLNVRTGISLSAWASRVRYEALGAGYPLSAQPGPVTRENFPDTAYWNARIITDENGDATVSINLPDTLTTWQVLVRGLTKETLVGEAKVEVITTKDLLIRPVTPRFLLVGDHVMLAAVVQNNTNKELYGRAVLEADGFTLDDPGAAGQSVTVPANGRLRLEWWGSAEDVPSASLRFSIQAGALQDAVLVSKGALPVLRYTAPQTFATSGSLAEGGQTLELVSLPVTFDATSGSLNIELNPSLAAAMLDSLDALENYPYRSSEGLLSGFLPNLVTYTTLQSFNIESPDLKARLDLSLNQSIQHLLIRQNADGGWGWWQGDESDEYLTAYILFGLATARNAGFTVRGAAIDNARSYIIDNLITPGSTSESWKLDRMAFELYALKQSGTFTQYYAIALYNVRDQLSPWAKAMLLLSFDSGISGSNQVPALVSDLQATAIRSATGIHWEAAQSDWRNMTSTLTNSAIVLYTLAQVEPGSTLLPDAVNFLMSNRQANGYWRSSYESAWILLAMDEVIKSTGELNSDYTFSADLNGMQVAMGEAGGETQLSPVTISLPISSLSPREPNALVIQRQGGAGKLYYSADLEVFRPVEEVAGLDRGISVSRSYYPFGSDLTTAIAVTSASVGNLLTVRLTVVVPTDIYYFVVEDYIPAGTEILNTELKTSRQGVSTGPGVLYDPRHPYRSGWGGWLFNAAQIYDDHLTWTASHLPPGTYDLTYTLTALQAGEYHILPAHAWMLYFPEVQGNSAGGLFEIEP